VEQVRPVLDRWRERGYKIALYRDMACPGTTPSPFIVSNSADLVLERFDYPGYAAATNEIISSVMAKDQSAEWFVTGGDDTWPDPNRTAEEIAEECKRYFGPLDRRPRAGSSFGVMQPTGDRWGDKDGAYIDRVAGSPWIGREFARRMYGGRGPYWPEYTHMGVDEELQAVAEKIGVFWQRPDLTHYHDHWGRPRPGEERGNADRMPAFLERANSHEEWHRYKRIFEARKAAWFPGHEPIA